MWIVQILWLLGAVLVITATLFSWLPFKKWWLRIWDFPRLQVLVCGVVLLLFSVLFGFNGAQDRTLWLIIWVLLIISLVRQSMWIIRMTPLFKSEVPSEYIPTQRSIKLIASNVDYTNEFRSQAIESLVKNDPDILALIEVDHQWKDLIQSYIDRYPHQVLELKNNGKGMALLSKIPIVESEIRYLVSEDRPSIWIQVRFPNHQHDQSDQGNDSDLVGICVLHPPPPGLMKQNKNERVSSKPRDIELVIASEFVADSEIKHWVMFGDFNDVGWSRTTEQAKSIGNLFDPRIGKGFYSTYHARRPLLRYPIDHVFVSGSFRVPMLACLDDIGSDHLPLLAELQLDQTIENPAISR